MNMHPMQAVINAIGAASRSARSDYHLTLGELIKKLKSEAIPSDALVSYDTDKNIGPGEEISYRGYYSDLAFQDGAPPTAENLLDQCVIALGGTYEGYKGGDYVMGEDTPLWRSEYGTSSGIAIIGAELHCGNILLKTKVIDDD